MNTIEFYNGISVQGIIDDNFLRSGTVERSVGLISERLDIDTFTFYAYSDYELHPKLVLIDANGKVLKTADGEIIFVKGNQDIDPTQFAKTGQKIRLDYTNSNGSYHLGEFYVQTVEIVGKALYKFTCQTLMGIMSTLTDVGGIINGITVYDLVARMFDGMGTFSVPFDFEAGLDTTEAVYGWLPYATKKENLLHVLFALGYVIVWDGEKYLICAAGDTNFDISKKQQLFGAKVSKLDRASRVELIEHSFFASTADILTTLFDNTAETYPADHALIVFNEPCHDLDFGNLTEVESGVNYAIVSGTGILTGYQYSHSQKVLTAQTNASSDRTARVENETLITYLNSKNALKRLVNLQNAAEEAEVEYYPENPLELMGGIGRFYDPFDIRKRGYLESIKYELSGTLKYNAKFLLGFKSGPYGSNIKNFAEFDYSKETQLWTVPDGVTEIQIVLGQGGTGGNVGGKGGDGLSGTVGYRDYNTFGQGGAGGAGGTGGNGGVAGWVYYATIPVTAGDIVEIDVGNGGTRGTNNHPSGHTGEHTVLTVNGTSYSSSSGSAPSGGYFNPLSGRTYSVDGAKGNDGYSGGTQSFDPLVGDYGEFEDILAEGYGAGSNGEYEIGSNRYNWYILGGGGGGGTYLEPYSAAEDGRDGDRTTWQGQTYYEGGMGGDGADAAGKETMSLPEAGCGGEGGDGGGGGGGGGGYTQARYDTGDGDVGLGGSGGMGGSAQSGGKGYAIIFY